VATNDSFIAGFTGAGASGSLSVHSRATGQNTFIDAPGNFSAAALVDLDGSFTHVVINGLGLGTFGSATGDAALFGLDDTATPQPLEILGLGTGQASSYVAISTDVSFVARFDLGTFSNDFFALPTSALRGAFVTPAVAPTLPATPVATFPAVLGTATLGHDLVVIEGDPTTFAATGVVVVPVRDDAGVIVADATQTMLTVDRCSSVTAVAAIGDNVLVVLDDNGQGRLLQIGREPIAP
jgi:hypothetical protein